MSWPEVARRPRQSQSKRNSPGRRATAKATPKQKQNCQGKTRRRPSRAKATPRQSSEQGLMALGIDGMPYFASMPRPLVLQSLKKLGIDGLNGFTSMPSPLALQFLIDLGIDGGFYFASMPSPLVAHLMPVAIDAEGLSGASSEHRGNIPGADLLSIKDRDIILYKQEV